MEAKQAGKGKRIYTSPVIDTPLHNLYFLYNHLIYNLFYGIVVYYRWKFVKIFVQNVKGDYLR